MTHVETPPAESGSGEPKFVPTSAVPSTVQSSPTQLSWVVTLLSCVATELCAMPVQPVSRSEPGSEVMVTLSAAPSPLQASPRPVGVGWRRARPAVLPVGSAPRTSGSRRSSASRLGLGVEVRRSPGDVGARSLSLSFSFVLSSPQPAMRECSRPWRAREISCVSS
jgi:hypothetical protein